MVGGRRNDDLSRERVVLGEIVMHLIIQKKDLMRNLYGVFAISGQADAMGCTLQKGGIILFFQRSDGFADGLLRNK